VKELRTLLSHHCREGRTTTAFPRLRLFRWTVTAERPAVITHPQFVAVAHMRLFLGNEAFEYSPLTYMIATVAVPVGSVVTEGPFLGLSLALDSGVLAGLLLEMPAIREVRDAPKALAVAELGGDLLDPVVRLIRLLDHPEHIPVLAPLLEREILYRLLLGPCGDSLRQLALPDSQLSHIIRPIDWLRHHFPEPVAVEELARLAGLSSSSFHRHFRAVTNMSPLQFQKSLRLQEARRRLLAQNRDAASIAFEVGYESPSQFSREYRRMFGAPPRADLTRTRRKLTQAACRSTAA
jgi:AraC-like DNA-binding protein